MEKPKKITIDLLAQMMNRAFESLGKDVKEIRSDLGEVKTDVVDLKKDMVDIKSRLDRIERKVDVAQENRLAKLEDDVRLAKTKLNL